jgi:hypothetical protein
MKPLRKFVIGLGMFVIISAIVGQHAPPTKATTEQTPPVEHHAKATAVLQEFPSYQKMGRRWRSVVISPNTTIEELAALMKRLHHEDPKTSFNVFTNGDTKQFRKYMLWTTHYATEKASKHPYPEAWANRHHVGHLHQFLPSQEWKLVVLQGSGLKPPIPWGASFDLD